MIPTERFWAAAEAVRQVSGRYGVEAESAQRVLTQLPTPELYFFRRELERLVRPLARWDQWAVGAILNGHLEPRFASNYFLWVVVQGEEFYKSVLRDPARAVERAPSDDPSCGFSFDCIATLPRKVIDSRTREEPLGAEWIETERLAGTPWRWRELGTLHPKLWNRYFLNRDHRHRHLPLTDLSDGDFVLHASTPISSWVDFYADPEYLVAQYGRLNKDQACLHAVWWCYLECQNGGMDQFFSNSTGSVACEALEGFQRFGADAHYRDLDRIMKSFPGGEPSRDRAQRKAQMEERWKDRTIDDEFSGGGLPELEPILAQYIRAHPDSFFRAG